MTEETKIPVVTMTSPFRERLLGHIYAIFTKKHLTEASAKAFWSWFITIAVVAALSAAYPTMLLIQAREQITKLELQVTDKKSLSEFAAMGKFVIAESGREPIVYVVGTEAEYPFGMSEAAKRLDVVERKLTEAKTVADAALKSATDNAKVTEKIMRAVKKKDD